MDATVTAAAPRLQALFLLALARNFGPAEHDRIVTLLGSLDALLDAPEDALAKLELTGGQLTRLLEVRGAADPARALERLAGQGISLVGWGDELYPPLLAQAADAPLLLFCRGDASLLRHYGIAIVGSRKCSEVGLKLAQQFGRELAALGLPVVSGMALGIDGAAHRGALDAPGPTIAVLGCGIDVVYPPQHHELYEELCERALVISEYAPGVEPKKQHFPQRNRIISGLAKGVLVVEAALGSGALITARLALEQGRDVFALPGPVTSPYTKGPHELIKSAQAKLVENVNDILVEYGTTKAALTKEKYASARLPLEPAEDVTDSVGADLVSAREDSGGAGADKQPPYAGSGAVEEGRAGATPTNKETLPAKEQRVLEVISYEGTHINDVVRRLGITTPECVAHLTMLEIKGLICASSGGYYIRL